MGSSMRGLRAGSRGVRETGRRSQESEAAPPPAAAGPAPGIPAAAGNQALQRALTGQAGAPPGTLPAPVLGAPSPRPGTIRGPLRPGERREDGDLTIQQHSAEDVEIRLGGSSLWIYGRAGSDEGYEYLIDPPVGSQRTVRITRTPGVFVDRHFAEADEEHELVVHEGEVERASTLAALGRLPAGDVLALELAGRAILTLDDTQVVIERADPEGLYAYSLEPGWTGPERLEKVVHVVATPGVRVEEATLPQAAGFAPLLPGFGRRLVADVIRVQDPAQVPPQGTVIHPEHYLGTTFAGGGLFALREGDGLLVSTGRQSVTIRDELTGSWVRIAPADPGVGAAFAYEVIDREHSATGALEVRVALGPGAVVEMVEAHDAAMMASNAAPILGMPVGLFMEQGAAFAGSDIDLTIRSIEHADLVPPQGAPIDPWLGRERAPDVHRYEQTTGQVVATAVHDIGIGAIPGWGDIADGAELIGAVATGRDRWGREVAWWEIALMGVGTLLPLVGSSVLRSGRHLRKVAGLARALRRSPDEIEAGIAALHGLSRQEREVLAQARGALRRGETLSDADVARVRSLLSGRAGAIMLHVPPGALRQPTAAAAAAPLPGRAANWTEVRSLVGQPVASATLPRGYRTYQRGGRTLIRREVADDTLLTRLTVDEAGLIQPGAATRASRRALVGRPELPRGRWAARLGSRELRVPEPAPVARRLRAEHDQILALHATDPLEAGRRYQDLIARDLRGEEVQEISRPLRRTDIGPLQEVALEGWRGPLGTRKLDQLWLDLRDNGIAILHVPRLSPAARDQLARLGAQARDVFGIDARIIVRQSVP